MIGDIETAQDSINRKIHFAPSKRNNYETFPITSQTAVHFLFNLGRLLYRSTNL
jgi:hypothetical protein